MAIVLSCVCSSAREILAGEDDDGHVAQARFGVHLLEQLEAGHVGQAQVEHHAVEGLIEHRLAGPRRPVPTVTHLDVLMAQQLHDRLPLDLVVLDDQQSLGARSREFLDAVERCFEALGCRRLNEVRERAMGKPCCRSSSR